ncbi:unnamed protein product [Meloidogyne enterolobii]|uniref:Uncharacterized protein n=1 Tax=Meloidogyne enterolobii TaxID=390850 RepID=A0ACB0ZEY1_MELEN
MVWKAAGQEYKRKGEKRLTFEEWLPIFDQLSKEKEVGSYADFMEGLKVFDKDESGKIMAAELRHVLLALGERLNTEEVDELLQGVEDGEGMVNYDREFFFNFKEKNFFGSDWIKSIQNLVVMLIKFADN